MLLLSNPPARAGAAVACLAAFLCSTGCGEKGPRVAPVKGRITYRGKAVPYGTVMFQPPTGPAATGPIEDGAYTLQTDRRRGAVLGPHKVTVIALDDQSGRLPEERSPFPRPLVPFQYSAPDRSGLTAVVEDKENVLDFHLN